MSDRYLERVLEGSALWTDIDDYIDAWHDGAGGDSLHEFLGMTWDEYALFAERPDSLRIIIAARQRDEDVPELLAQVDEHAIAARGLSIEDAQNVRQWLQATGRLPKD